MAILPLTITFFFFTSGSESSAMAQTDRHTHTHTEPQTKRQGDSMKCVYILDFNSKKKIKCPIYKCLQFI